MEDLINTGKQYVMNTYNRYPIVIDRGQGCYVWDTDNKKYLDFVAGIAVNSLGHNYGKLVDKISEQAASLIHCSNLYYNKPQIDMAKKLVKNSDFDKVFFCNSGAEANEAALKLSRKYAVLKNKPGREIITMLKSFHGRTYGAVTATGQEKYHEGLDPVLPGIKHVEFNDIDALNSCINENTCAILMEPIQGEGGIIPADKTYLEKIREICTQKDILLIFDEVQTGVGRTGELFCYETYGVVPDVVTLAKGLAGGIPIGAMLTVDKVAEAFKPGDHASTFGGNPLAASAGCVVIDELLNSGILFNVKESGTYLTEKLLELKGKHSIIKGVRGIGFLQGIELSVPVSEIIGKCIENGLLLAGAGANVIRFVPPLIATKTEIDKAVEILGNILNSTDTRECI